MNIKDFAYELYKVKWTGSHCNLQVLEETIADAFETVYMINKEAK
jgi:hypothetical protein